MPRNTTSSTSPMHSNSPYTGHDLRRAVNLAACLGWLGFCAPWMVDNPALLPWLALFGLPIALLACWVIGAPILRYVMRRQVTWRAAGLWGAVIAAIIASLWIAFSRWRGLQQSRDPNSFSQIGGRDNIQSIDGILTPYGWWVLGLDTAAFVLSGAAVGLLVRWRIGPGAPPTPR